MPRYAFRIEYNGSPFNGWQRQPDLPSVQGAIETCLARLNPTEPRVNTAGRTDTGVHATGQVAHVDLDNDWVPNRLMEALNHHLKPLPIAIIDCAAVSDDFHARFSATERRYTFRLVARRAPVVLEADLVWHVRNPLDLSAMQHAAAHLIGHHDFTTFRASQCQANSPMKTMDEVRVEELPYAAGAEFRFHLRSRSFLHNQVRSIVGTLERVGSGRWHPDRMAEALAAKDRTACGPVSPPQGLYLAGVGYAQDPFDPA
mgnify:FL=1|jgi:tRNA pseudouridine38-40 synthase